MFDLLQKHTPLGSAVKLAEAIEREIRDGELGHGERLPVVRELAKALDLSPGTVASAYRLLQQRGLIVTEGRRGTWVSMRRQQPLWLDPEVPDGVVDLYNAEPDLALLPDLSRFVDASIFELRPYAEAGDEPELIDAARAAFRANGVVSDHVMISAGAIAIVKSALGAHLRPGDGVAVEDPAYCGHLDLLAMQSLKPIGVAIDEEGLQPAALEAALARGARAVICSPRFQSPMGSVLTGERAKALRAILARYPDVLIIEDDYAYLIAIAPYHGLVTPDARRWVVAYSLNKSIAPDLRLGFAAGDRETIDRMRLQQSLAEGWNSAFLQRIALRALADEATRRSFRHAAETYAARRMAARRALEQRGIKSFGDSGLNIWIPVPEETMTVQQLRAKGWAVRAGERFRLEADPAIRVTTSRLMPDDAGRFADDLAVVLQGAATPRQRP